MADAMTAPAPIDPVCGMAMATWEVALDRGQSNIIYHFCSPQCAARFAESPERYTAPGRRPVPRRVRERVTLPIFGLDGDGAGPEAVQRDLLRTPGVLWAHVNLATEMAYIEYQPGQITHDGLIDVIEETGYCSLRAGPAGDGGTRRRDGESEAEAGR